MNVSGVVRLRECMVRGKRVLRVTAPRRVLAMLEATRAKGIEFIFGTAKSDRFAVSVKDVSKAVKEACECSPQSQRR
jgi:hypothetical protein